MKFSLIVPCYNVDKYLAKCLDSIIAQTYDDFEVLIINDGSPDNTEAIAKKYVKKDKRLKYFAKENGGLSDARNYGIEKATGDYYLFIDSDDYLANDLLNILTKHLKKDKVDMLKFRIEIVDDNGQKLNDVKNNYFNRLNVEEALPFLLKDQFIEPAWNYVYKNSLFKNQSYRYPVGKIHEDFALTLLLLREAKMISSIDYVGYYYVQRENSIMSNPDYNKIKKRVNDFLEHNQLHINKFTSNTLTDKLLLSYSSEATIYKGNELKEEDQAEYINELKNRNIYKFIYPSSFKKRLKKIYLILFTKSYYKRLKRRK